MHVDGPTLDGWWTVERWDGSYDTDGELRRVGSGWAGAGEDHWVVPEIVYRTRRKAVPMHRGRKLVPHPGPQTTALVGLRRISALHCHDEAQGARNGTTRKRI